MIKANEKIKIAMVSSILPATNYTAYLIEAFQKKFDKKAEILVYTSLEKENKKADLKNIKLVWSKNYSYPFQILKQVLKDKPQVVHLQHEINMFGNLPTTSIFPLLPFLLKITTVKVVITVHAVVAQKQINGQFIDTFWTSKKEYLLPFIRLFFRILFKSISWFSDKIIVHTEGLKRILIEDYGFNSKKIVVIPHGVPEEIRVIQSRLVESKIKNLVKNNI